MKPDLTIDALCQEAGEFSRLASLQFPKELYGVTDGKAIGTYLEHQFQDFLAPKYHYLRGSSAQGIDFPEIGVDMKVTQITQPQSSCPFKSARQKIYGLGYSLLVFVYDKEDNHQTQAGRLNILHTVFVHESRTADYQATVGIRQILENNGNIDDLIAFILDRRLPVDEIQAEKLAEEILDNRPAVGYLTISNALQWRLQYRRVIEEASAVEGIVKIR